MEQLLPVGDVLITFMCQECARVLRPGGCIEVTSSVYACFKCRADLGAQIIEEDLLFPAGRTRKPDAAAPSPAGSMRRVSAERIRSDSTASRLTSQTSQTSQTTQSTQTTNTSSSYLYTTERSSQGSSSHDSFLSSSSRSRADSSAHLFAQDHARLKEAWEEMLSQRFLTHKLLNVLPFYLSSFFTNVHVHPTMHVVLPPPSTQRERKKAEPVLRPDAQEQDIAEWVEDMRAHAVQLSSNGPKKSDSAALRGSKPSVATISLWGALHLARQVHLVSACKEAIWEAYFALTGAARDAFLHPNDTVKELPREDLREEFEREWAAWER